MNHNLQHTYDSCKNHMHSYVLIEMSDGAKVDGIVTGLDDEYVYVAVPIGQGDDSPAQPHHQQRQFGFGGYGGYNHGYGYNQGYPGYGYRPRRRFNRLVLPLAALTALSVLPWY